VLAINTLKIIKVKYFSCVYFSTQRLQLEVKKQSYSSCCGGTGGVSIDLTMGVSYNLILKTVIMISYFTRNYLLSL